MADSWLTAISNVSAPRRRQKSASGGLSADVQVYGQAPVRLTAADGRVSQFPRVWASVATPDGRSGVGWVEWNRNLAE